MATTTPGNPQTLAIGLHDGQDEETWDEKIEELLAAGDLEAARRELDRQDLAGVSSCDPISLEDAVKHRIPGYTVDVLLHNGDIEGARAELERLVLEGVDSGDSIEMTPQAWHDLRLDLHRRAGIKG